MARSYWMMDSWQGFSMEAKKRASLTSFPQKRPVRLNKRASQQNYGMVLLGAVKTSSFLKNPTKVFTKWR